MFAEAFRNDRVLIPATGFFEWDRGKCRHLFTFDEPLFAFGGLARDCEIKGETRRCGVIMTTDANDVVVRSMRKGACPLSFTNMITPRGLIPLRRFPTCAA
jgi:putative SOS response-associated peptidase YedK